jgi:hypothetical protein
MDTVRSVDTGAVSARKGRESRVNTPAQRLAFLIAAIAAALTAACATTGQKSVTKMTLDEYIAAHPECVRGRIMPDGDSAKDITECQDNFGRDYMLALGGRAPGISIPEWKVPKNASTEESDVGRPGFPKLYEATDKDSAWFRHNMVRQPGESRDAFAKRVEEIAEDFLSTQLADINLSIENCGVDFQCLNTLLVQSKNILRVMSLCANQAIAAHDSMGNYDTASELKERFGVLTRQFAGIVGTLSARVNGANARRSGK